MSKIDTILEKPTRNEKVAWKRKQTKMKKLLAQIQPIEERIIALEALKIPVYDEMAELRIIMAEDCVHLEEFLIQKEDHVLCKFCNRKIHV